MWVLSSTWGNNVASSDEVTLHDCQYNTALYGDGNTQITQGHHSHIMWKCQSISTWVNVSPRSYPVLGPGTSDMDWVYLNNKHSFVTGLESGKYQVIVKGDVVSGECPTPNPSFSFHLTWAQVTEYFPVLVYLSNFCQYNVNLTKTSQSLSIVVQL